MKRIVQKFGIFLVFFALSVFPIDAAAEKPRPIILGFGGDPLSSMFQLTFPNSGRVKLVQEILSGRVVKNKPRYQSGKMDWQIYESKHFKLYSYEDSNPQTQRAEQSSYDGKGMMVDWYLSVLEKAYENNSRRFGVNTFEDKIPVIIYNSRKDFEETNVTPALIPRTLGGFTETQYKKRVVLPFDGSKEIMRHVLEHELTHSFQVEILKKQAPNAPLWFIEGMAEHNSKSWDAEADLILRDAYFNNLLPSLQRNSFAYGYLLYKYGEFAVNYINDNCKSEEVKDPIKEIISETKKSSFDEALQKNCREMTLEGLDQSLRAELGKRYGELKNKDVVYFKSQLLAKNSTLLDANNYFFITQTDYFGRDAIYLNYRQDNGIKIVSEKIAESERYKTQELYAKAKILGNKIAYIFRKDNNDAVVIQEFQLDEKQKIRLGSKKEYSWKEIRDISDLVFTSSSSLALIGSNNEFEQIYQFDSDSRELKIIVPGNNNFKGLAYSHSLKILVTAIENDAENKKTNLDLISIDSVNGKIQRLTQTLENETGSDFSPDGKSLLFVSDKGLGYNLYSYNFENGIVSKLTDARIGVFNPKWLSESVVAFNTFSKAEFGVYAMPLPKTASLKNKKGLNNFEEAERESRLDKLLGEKIAGWEDYEVVKKVFSGDKKIAIAVVNRNVSFEGKNKKSSPVIFFTADLEKENVQKFSIEEIKKVENFAGLEILHGSNVLIGYRTTDADSGRQIQWYLYNWDSQKLEEIERPVKQAEDGELLGKGGDISGDGRYAVISAKGGSALGGKKSGKICLMDTLENKIVWDCEEKGFMGINFSSNNVIVVLKEINPRTYKVGEGIKKPAKTFEFQILSIPDFSVISTYDLPADSLGNKNSKIENWVISPDNRKIAIDVKNEEKRFFRKNIESHELRLINIPQNKTEVIANRLSLITELGFDEKGLKAKGLNSFGNICDYSVSDSSKTAIITDEPALISTETAKLPESEIIFPSFKPEKIVKRKGAKPPSRFPTVMAGSAMGGFVWDVGRNKPAYTLNLSMFGSDDLGNRIYGINTFLFNESGFGQFVFRDAPSGQTLGLRYWDMGENGKSVTLSYAKNIFINKFLNWDITASEEYVEFKNRFPYKWLSEKSLKTRIGTTFSLDTTVWNNHGPHSGNVLFTGTEMAVNPNGEFSSLDIIAEGRNYLPITDRSGLAFRLASGKSIGPKPTIFIMGGNKAFRGMPFLKVYGNNYILGSIDLRIPLFDFIGAQTSGPSKYVLWPFMQFMDVQNGIYIDGGNAWYNKGQTPYSGNDAFVPDYSAGYFINVPTAFGLTLRFSRGVYGQKGSTFWIGYNW